VDSLIGLIIVSMCGGAAAGIRGEKKKTITLPRTTLRIADRRTDVKKKPPTALRKDGRIVERYTIQ
jgi:hypothetical protein